MYLSLSEWYHGVRANWTLILREYKYHIKESDPFFFFRICTLPTDKGINSLLMDMGSWIYDLKTSFYMKLGSQVFPLKLPAEFWHEEKKRRANLVLLCFSYFLFSTHCFPFSLSPLSHKVCDMFAIYSLMLQQIDLEVGLWYDKILQLILWAYWLSFELPLMVIQG